MTSHPKAAVRFTQGRSSDQGGGEPKALPWAQFLNLFKDPLRTKEKRSAYDKLPEAEQKRLKMLAGWWFRSQNKGKRRKRGSALPSDLITLDFDYATPEFFRLARTGKLGVPWEYFIHTSRRHTPEKPRFRLVILLKKPVPNDLYGAVSRIAAQQLDPLMEHVDAVSFRQAQMMYMPTASADGEYVFARHEGEALDYEALLDEFDALVGDWHDLTVLPRAAGEKKLRETQDKAEDPTEKDGPVGWFCRAHDVEDAILTFDLPYEPVDLPSSKPRYTYTLGTTTNGAEVQDDGLFLYSHHGSDPTADQLVNAFDLVRIHKFGDLDAEVEDDTPMAKRPSWKAMIELCEADEGYRNERAQARYDTDAMWETIPEEDRQETPEDHEPLDDDLLDVIGPFNGHKLSEDHPAIVLRGESAPIRIDHKGRRPKPSKKWVNDLDMDQNGNVKSNATNIAMILTHDSRFRDVLAFNQFEHRPVCVLPLRTNIGWLPKFDLENPLSGDAFQDQHRALIRALLEAPNGPGKVGWGLKVSDRDLKDGLLMAAFNNSFHPVREVLSSFKHDGKARAELLFIDYLGCPDTPYHRAAARLFLIAAVARAFEPGCKFDFMPVLVGAQGVRKSTFIRILALGWFGDLRAQFDNDQKLGEQMAGNWIMENAELAALVRSGIEDIKAFLSGQELQYRTPYASYPTVFKRQTVFMGSTNTFDFLKDDTGNRRFWPIEVLVDAIDTDRLIREVPQIWAEAVTMYRALRAAHPTGDLPLYLDEAEAATEAKSAQAKARRVSDVDLLADFIQDHLDEREPDGFDGTTGKRREWVSVKELIPVVEESRLKFQGGIAQHIANALVKLGWEQSTARTTKGGQGKVRPYYPGPEQLRRWAEEDTDTFI